MRVSRQPPLPAPPEPAPRTPFGRYTLVERMAVGGMAEIFVANEKRTVGEPRTLVVKRMLPSLRDDPEARAMFATEGRIGALIQHENVVTHFAAGEEGGVPYLALELVPGLDLWRLTRWLARHGQTMGVPLALYVVQSVLRGLHAVHTATDADGQDLQVVHRDVSPSNVLLSIHGEVKLADLGIASSSASNAPQSRAKGKLGYLSPEQVQGLPTDARADVFSAAVLAAELLTGKPLFYGGSELAVLLAIRDGDVRTFRESAATLPTGLAELMLDALNTDPVRRIQSANDFATRLLAFDDTPVSVLRRELGELVRSAAAAASGEDSAGAPTPLEEILTPLELAESIQSPTTMDMPTIDYRVRTTDGREQGPWPYAKIVEAVATARLGLEDLVSTSGGPFRKIAEVPELARHLPLHSLSMGGRDNFNTPKAPDLIYDIANGGFVRALVEAAVEKRTGLLLCEQGGVRKEVYLRQGKPEFVTSNLAGELLGEFLVAKGVISRGELDMALAVMPRYEGKLGDTLSALGLVEPMHLFQHITGQVREKLLDIFLWTSGRASLWLGIEVPPGGFPLQLESYALIEEGLGRQIAQGFDGIIGETYASSTFELVRHAELDTSELPMNVQRFLAALVNPKTLDELRTISRRPPGDPLALAPLVLLVHAGLATATSPSRSH
jgi:serine/threonine protein kinase